MAKRLVFILLVLAIAGCSTGMHAAKETQDAEALLRERASEFWTATVNKDRGRAYDLFDPFFRALVTKEWWIAQGGNVGYYGFEIAGVNVRGNVASVSVKLSYQLKYFSTHFGKEIEGEKTEKIITEKWLFIDGNWYKQFVDGITDGTFAHY